jgi:hypothetical protein
MDIMYGDYFTSHNNIYNHLENYEPDDIVVFKENQNPTGEILTSLSSTTPTSDDDIDQIPNFVIDDEQNEATIEIDEDNNPFYLIDERPIPPPVTAPAMNPNLNREMKNWQVF